MLLLLLLAFLEDGLKCEPQPVKQPPKQERRAAARAREAKAHKRAQASEQFLRAREFQRAIDEATATLDLTPQRSNTLRSAYRTLGYANAYLGRKDEARRWMTAYCCLSDECRSVRAFLAQ